MSNYKFQLEDNILNISMGNVPILNVPLLVGSRFTLKTNQDDVLYVGRHSKDYISVSICKKGKALKRVYMESNTTHYAVFRDGINIRFQDSNENNRKTAIKNTGLCKRLEKLGFRTLNQKSFILHELSVKVSQKDRVNMWALFDTGELIAESKLFSEEFEDFIIKYVDKKGYLN